MGIATILIVYYHMPYSQDLLSPIGEIFKNRCFSGVDIFLFLSGFGLYFSYCKDNNKMHFYIKRIKRIYPSFFIVTILICIYQNDAIFDIISKLSTLGYWFGYPFVSWYISAIFMFYLLFPFYMEIFNKNPQVVSILTILFGVIITIPIYFIFSDLRIGFFSRIPIFTLGIFSGYISKTKNVILSKCRLWFISISLIIIGAISGIVLKYYLPQYIDAWNPLPFIFITPSILIILTIIFESYYLETINTYIIKFFTFIGLLSLEIYIIHEPLMSLLKFPPTSFNLFIVEFVIIILVSYIAAFFLQRFINKIIKMKI